MEKRLTYLESIEELIILLKVYDKTKEKIENQNPSDLHYYKTLLEKIEDGIRNITGGQSIEIVKRMVKGLG